MRTHCTVGAITGGGIGLLFSLVVVSMADCVGPGCTGERVVGVAGHMVGGALVGAAAGALVYLVRRAL